MQTPPQVSDFIALLGLISAVFALIAIPFGLYIDRQGRSLAAAQRELAASIEKLSAQSLVIQETNEAICRYASQSGARDQFMSAVLEKLVTLSPELARRAPRFRESNEKLSRTVSEALNDLQILSSSESARLSAFRTAANEFRTLRALRKMESATKLYSETRPECSAAMRALEDHLNSP